MTKKVDAFARAKSARACSDCPDPAERAKEFLYGKKVHLVRRVTLASSNRANSLFVV